MVVTARTESEAKIGRRIAGLRYAPAVIAVAVVFWVMLRMIAPYRAEFVVVDPTGQAIAGAEVWYGENAAKARETDEQGRCAIWISRDRDNRHTTVDVRIPELGIRYTEGRSWRDMRRGQATHLTVPLGDTVAGTSVSELSGARIPEVRAVAVFDGKDGRGAPVHSANWPADQYGYRGPRYFPGSSNSGDGSFFVTRPPMQAGAAESVELTIWAPGHAPRKLVLEPSRTARGHVFFDAGVVVLAPWARAQGRLNARSSGRSYSHMGLLRAVVWTPAAATLEGMQGDPAIERVGRDGDRPYAILRNAQQWSTTFDVTLPLPAERVVLMAVANDRPPCIVEVAPERVAALAPDGQLSLSETLEFPAPNPMTLKFLATGGGTVPFAQVTFARFLPGTEIAIPVREAVLTTNATGALTTPSLEDGERYEITVLRRSGESVTFESVVEPRGEIVVPEQ